MLADWTWTGWDRIQSLDVVRTDGSELSTVPLRFQDSWRAGLGFNVRLDERWKLRLGTAYDKAPVQDEFRTPRLPDEDRIWAAGGFEWRLGARGALDFGYAHLFIKEATSSLPNQGSATSPPAGAMVGTYTTDVDIFSLQYRVAF